MVQSAFAATQIQITNEVEMALQLKGGVLMPYVRSGEHYGKKAAVVRLLGSAQMNTVSTPGADFTYQDIAHTLRFIEHKSFNMAVLESTEEAIQTGGQSFAKDYASSFVDSIARKQDDLILSSLFDTARIGESGGSTEAFDSTNQVVSTDIGGTGSGLNPTKLDKARDILVRNGVDFDRDEVYIGVSAADESSLIGYTTMTSTDFTGPRPVLLDGKLNSYRGMKFVPIQYNSSNYSLANGLLVPSTTVRYCPVWVKSGVYYGSFMKPTVKIDILPNKQHAVQVAGYLQASATRLENKKVVRIACTYNAGA